MRRRSSPLVSAVLLGLLVTATPLLAPVAAVAAPELDAPAFQVRDHDAATIATTLAARATLPAHTRVWVHLTDKDVFDSGTCAERLDAYAATLSDRVLRRRMKMGGARPVDFHDLPVHGPYVERLEALGADVHRESRWLNAVSVRATSEVLAAIAAEPFVASMTLVQGSRRVAERLAAPSGAGHADDIRSGGPQIAGPPSPSHRGGDPFDYGPSRDQLDEIGVIDAHAAGYSGAGTVVAMFDTGYMEAHPGMDHLAPGRVLAEYDFVDDDGETDFEEGDDPGQYFHGTATWSLVAALEEGELIGVAHGADYLLAKTEDVTSETPVEEDSWVAAAEWADLEGADVINSSLSYWDWYTYEDMDGDTAPITIAADLAVERGIVVCASAGNNGTQDWFYISAPADGDSVITVGATTPSGDVWDDSSHGPTFDGRTKPDVCARGDETYCAEPPEFGDPFRTLSGTSVSSPLVAGAAALLLEAHPDATPIEVRDALRATADNADTPDNHRGWGRIDVPAAIAALSTVSTPDVVAAHPGVGLRAAPNPMRAGTTFSFSHPGRDAAGPRTVRIFSADGRLVRALSTTEAMGSAASVTTPIPWDGRTAHGVAAPPGVYLAEARAGSWRATTKLVLNR